jgi:asparagine synthase (glutamine-hydrolysing)
MCGICGKVLTESGNVEPALVCRMCAALVHRGPDEEGSYHAPGVALGMRRLAIIDLTPGRIPVQNEDGTVTVVFNGEIYNYRALREDLLRRGHRFATETDTEVLVHLYEDEGERLVERLNGMFAFALWDARRRRLVLARDRLGEKPLVYRHGSDSLTFASELGALLCDPAVPRGVDPVALHYYFAFGRVPAPLTIYSGVRKLPPAHVLVYERGEVRLWRYWRPSFARKLRLSEDEWCEGILHHLERSVRLRLISDVPLGAFLSGGVDSSAVVAAMARAGAHPVRTFTIGFEDQEFSELPYARMVAERYGTEHHEFVLRPDAAEVLPRLVRHFGEPFADSSAIPTYYVSRETRRYVTVALTGDGGDESFAGYEWFVALKAGLLYGRLPAPVRRAIAGALGALPEFPQRRGPLQLLRRARRFAAALAGRRPTLAGTMFELLGGYSQARLLDGLYTPQMQAIAARHDPATLRQATMDEYDGDDPLEALAYAQLLTLLPDAFFTKVDIASMACSLECRAPFADHELVEFAAQIPFHLKMGGPVAGFGPKYLLKKALAKEWLPRQVLYREKRGFSMPLARWLREELRPMLLDLLGESALRDQPYLEPRAVQRMIDEHFSGRANHAARLWPLLVFQLWSSACAGSTPAGVQPQPWVSHQAR